MQLSEKALGLTRSAENKELEKSKEKVHCVSCSQQFKDRIAIVQICKMRKLRHRE